MKMSEPNTNSGDLGKAGLSHVPHVTLHRAQIHQGRQSVTEYVKQLWTPPSILFQKVKMPFVSVPLGRGGVGSLLAWRRNSWGRSRGNGMRDIENPLYIGLTLCGHSIRFVCTDIGLLLDYVWLWIARV